MILYGNSIWQEAGMEAGLDKPQGPVQKPGLSLAGRGDGNGYSRALEAPPEAGMQGRVEGSLTKAICDSS